MTNPARRTWLAPVGGICGVVLAVIAVAIATQPHLHVSMPTAVEIAGGHTQAAGGDDSGSSPRFTLVYPRRSVDVLDESATEDATTGSASAGPEAEDATPSQRPTPLARPLPHPSDDSSAAQPTGEDPSSTSSWTGTRTGSGEPPDDGGWTPSTSKSPSRSPSPSWHPSPTPTRSWTRTPTPSASPSTTRSDE